MDREKLDEILDKHKKWLNGDPDGKCADLREADLRGADLRRANLQEANLQEANLWRANLWRADLRGANLWGADLWRDDLREADLRGADTDFCAWPLWCGSLDVKVDRRIAVQMAYHFCRLDCDDPDYIKARNAILDFANTFHRVDECGCLKRKGEGEWSLRTYLKSFPGKIG